MSDVLYLGVSSCLYEKSCSSSIITIPKSATGANIADLAPITIPASFALNLLNTSLRSLKDNLL